MNKAGKRSKAYWAKSYQAVKHDRYNSLYLGNLKALLQAMGALYLLNIYYKEIKISTKYLDYHKIDMSFGSKIFSLKLPNDDYIINVVNGNEIEEQLRSSECPYILKYTDSAYRQIIDEYKNAIRDINAYLMAQPELLEPLFKERIAEAKQKEKDNPHNRCICLCELCKYKLNKKIPEGLPFEERKRLFVQSREWAEYIKKISNPNKECELTADNLQDEINHAGVMAGMELSKRFEIDRMEKALSGYCELVLDKGDVKYVK